MNSAQSVIVIGSGVSGLSTALVLQRHGYAVRIWTRERIMETTSAVAAAFWFPYRAHPVDRVTVWGDTTFAVLTEMSKDPHSGVFFREAHMHWREPAPTPPWHATVRHFRRLTTEELPPTYVDGFSFETQVVEMPIYLRYLEDQFLAQGGTIEQRTVAQLEDVAAATRLIVNCSGLGSYELLGDTELRPIRGQIVRVAPAPVDTVLFDSDEHCPTYIVPRSGDCILGGTALDGDWSTEPLPETAQDIRERCGTVAPATRTAAVQQHLVGLRPGRSCVRLEAERLPNGTLVVHNYGHGGAGITLSWGCAEDVLQHIQAATPEA